MHDHRRIVSWSDTPQAFPELTTSQRTKPGRSSRRVYSQFLSPSGMPEQLMHALPKTSTSTLYDDPAFSPDPRAHPYFATNTAPWVTPFQPKSNSIGQASLPHLLIPSAIIPDQDDSQLLQPPNTPMFSDDHSSTTHETSSSSNHTSTSSASLSTPPTSTDSHSSPWIPAPPEKPAQPLPWPPETQQRRRLNLSMFWRKTPTETVSDAAGSGRHTLPEPSHSRTPASTPRPTAPRSVTAPETIKPPDRPILTPRSATTAADSRPPPTASRRIIGGVAIRIHELDRIDELDESNPMGLPLHHRGPYEAISTAQLPSQQLKREAIPHNIGSHYQASPSSVPKRSIDRNRSQGSKDPGPIAVPIIPAGVSLKLEPGQILPRDFYHQLDRNIHRAIAPSDAPGWPPQSRSRTGAQRDLSESNQSYQWQIEVDNLSNEFNPEQLHVDHKRHSSHDRNAPPEYSVYPTDATALNTNAATIQGQYSASDFSREKHDRTLTETKRSKRHSSVENSQFQRLPQNGGQPTSDHRAPTPLHRSPSNPRLPPRMQALQMQNARPDESHRRSPKPQSVSQDDRVEPNSDQVARRRRSLVLGPVPNALMDASQQLPANNNVTLNVVPSIFEASQTFEQQSHLYHTPQNLQQRNPDSGSSHRSLHSNPNSTNSGNSKFIPPSHVPQRLIMPAPLQQSQLLVPRYQYEPSLGHIDSHHNWQPHLRTSSDVAPIINTQMAKDMASPQGRRLRKRNSVQSVIPQPPFISPSQPLTFEPTSLYTNTVPSQPAPPDGKRDKTSNRLSKRVLSKKRTDF